MTPNSGTGAPVLPVAISQSPLLSAGALPEELFSTFFAPLPTITIGTYSPTSPRVGTGRVGLSRPPRHHSRIKPLSTPSSPLTPSAHIAPKQVISLLNLLESMENDVATEVQRVRLGIQETRMLVRACREDSTARESAKQRLAKERR